MVGGAWGQAGAELPAPALRPWAFAHLGVFPPECLVLLSS